MPEAGGPGHVEVAGLETTRLVQQSAIAAIAELLALGECAAHALLQPATFAGPVFAHTLDAEDGFGGFTMARIGCAGIHGARAALPSLAKSETALGAWLRGLRARAHVNTVVVALAAKLARVVWAVLRHGGRFEIKPMRAI